MTTIHTNPTVAEPKSSDPTPQPPTGGVQLHVGPDGIAVLALGEPDSVVTLTPERLDSLERALAALAADARVRGVLVTGPGPGMFCVGADLGLFATIPDAATGAAAAARGRDVFLRCRALRVPVVAAIDGPCLGGGFELALCCDRRLASDHPRTRIGLPETKLGIVPGFGGTQHLVRRIGLPRALALILGGKTLPAKPAQKQGLVDRVVPAEKLLASARAELDRLVAKRRKPRAQRPTGFDFLLTHTPLRALAVRQARRSLGKAEARHYPALAQALDCCVAAVTRPARVGYALEAQALGQTIVSPVSRALVHLFRLGEQQKKLGRNEAASDLQRALVVGGGVMGAGIASVLARGGLTTRLCDLDLPTLARAKARLQGELDQQVARRHLTQAAAQAVQDRLAVATEWGSLRHTDVWLEAVVEDLATKQRLVASAVARGLPDTALIATNTSSLSVAAIAGSVPHPERVVGLHFFNPPEKMPLVEVVRGPASSDAAVASACRLVLRLGKTPLVVADAPGFLVNRCLAPYLDEAARLCLEGTEPEAIDAALRNFGMPMGPCRLLDEIGWDTAAKVCDVLHAAFPERLVPSELFAAMARARHLGRKSGGGLYGADGKRPGPGRAVLTALRAGRPAPGRQAPAEEIVARTVLPLVAEAFRCLQDGVVQSEAELDLGLVLGIGFPPFHGGVATYAARQGLANVVQQLDELARRHGPRFAAPELLRQRAVAGGAAAAR
ncbi:MAG: enoyl-CoA hydratase/isomerase family protein [Planctomycetes bacterium]|nr:enoyl-CoA hydratase/isomerase family protein [Planctomycetota bacterium]